MPEYQIPNLLSSRGMPRSRGRGRGRGGSTQIPPSLHRDQVIQGTDTDAAVSRFSAVSLGYLDDPFAHYFVSGQAARRLPIINRGTYARTKALDSLIDAFLESPGHKQIISLGAGTDTRYFRLRAQGRHLNVTYHELDFPNVCAAKYKIINSNEALVGGETVRYGAGSGASLTLHEPRIELSRSAGEVGNNAASRNQGTEVGYFFHPLDLRLLRTIQGLDTFQLNADLPTLIISECCLCYFDVNVATEVLEWFTDKIQSVGVILYEPIGVNDAFGQRMAENLAARGITMPTVQRYKDSKDQISRLKDLGFGGDDGGTFAIDMENFWEKCVRFVEKERLHRLEGLDEIEEWQLLARHYIVVWGWRGTKGWETWRTRDESLDVH